MLLPWCFGKRQWTLGDRPHLMGIVNVTPDSFSDGGNFLDPQRAVDHALQLVEEGADILDLGGESTRPGAEPVSLDDELRRVLPVVELLAEQTDVPLSIDTTKAEVARRCLQAGAEIINDISGLTFDDDMPDVCAEYEAGIVCMHIKGTPQTMQQNPTYEDCVQEIRDWLQARLEFLESRGLKAEQTIIDPGIGFGKTAEHNLTLLSSVQLFRALGRPVLVGHSRKRFLKKIIGRDVDERLAGTVGVAIALAAQQTDIIRVHDVAAVRDSITAYRTVMQQIPMP
ncbi:dihydropteroate synthase [Rubinisphaera sp. JC750]|uniref:dihydropteroate synthase n=1 Tax=Rubinisphaera sp. JC750 TaxID=2898658 RepID=UPI001F004485|nr:dihydropteroate synthase [Rubinisphaera sp. JC750]